MNSKFTQLINQLHEKTVNNKINWEETAEENIFLVSFSDYSVEIADYSDESHDLYKLRIYNKEGKIVDKISSDNCSYLTANELKEVYENARRKAMGADEALGELLESLNEI
ncbi:MAG: hypothetical protein C4527_00430 [Candidatus Omnitrophota bacterium]|jgi:predicted transcriptional regulator|nr:MAG: hypothetical protein C4527_00430 [Candidatus Omnitrophota bacterium]